MAAALFAFIYFVERPATKSAKPQNHALLPGLQTALISRIEFKLGTNNIHFERTNDSWRVVAPVTYPAMQQRLKDFLDRASKLAWTGTISASDISRSTNGLVDYGLQPPHAQFTLVQNNRRTEVKIGNPTIVDGQRYVQIGDEVQAYLVDEKILTILPLTGDFWRDSFVLPQTGMNFNRVEVRTARGASEFQRDETNQVWRITKPISARADNIRFKDWLQQLRTWNLYAFVDTPPANLDSIGLKTPELELIFAQGTNEFFNLQIGATVTNNLVFARRSLHSNVVVVANQLLEPFNGNVNEFRDRRLLTFPTNQVDSIKIQSTDSFTLQRLTNGNWQLLEQTNFVVDTVLVNDMLRNMNSLDVLSPNSDLSGFVKDVVTDLSPYGLDRPAHSYQLYNSTTNQQVTNALIAELDLGAFTPENGTIFARRPDESSVYRLMNFEAQKLPRALYQIRDRRIWNFATNEVKQIIIEQAGNRRELVRSPKGVWGLAPGQQGIVNPFAVDETLYRLGEMRAVRWLASGQASMTNPGYNLQNHAVTIILDRDGREERLVLRIGNQTPNRNAYAAVILDGKPVVFELPNAVFDYVSSYLNAPPPPGAKQ